MAERYDRRPGSATRTGRKMNDNARGYDRRGGQNVGRDRRPYTRNRDEDEVDVRRGNSPVRRKPRGTVWDKPARETAAEKEIAPRKVQVEPAEREGREAVLPEGLLAGRNALREAMRAGQQIDKIYVVHGVNEGSAGELLAMARERRIAVQEVAKVKLDEICGGVKHQGFAAVVPAHEYASVEDMLALAKERGEKPFLIALDSIEDPHNLGAIIRSAECCGAHGVILPRHRAVGLTAVAAKAAAGAAAYVPVARVTNLVRTLEDLKKQGFWVCGTQMENAQPYYDTDLSGALVLVIGSEGKGLSHVVAGACDFMAMIPMKGKVSSFNASVAAGILMAETARQRSIKG